MGRTLRQKRNTQLGVKHSISVYGRQQILGPHGPVIVTPSTLPDGMQEVKLRVPMKMITCLEARCPIFLSDRIDPVTEKVITAGTLPCGALHKAWDGRPVAYFVKYGGGDTGRFLEESEFVDLLSNGIYAINESVKRGDIVPE